MKRDRVKSRFHGHASAGFLLLTAVFFLLPDLVVDSATADATSRSVSVPDSPSGGENPIVFQSRAPRFHSGSLERRGDDPNYVSVLEEGFENGFPAANNWRVFFNEDFAPYRWDEEDFEDDHAGWCVGFSESSPEFPQLDPAKDDYVDDLTSWMVWGPFDARDADSVFVDFDAWLDTQPGDSLYFGAATDGFNFLGWRVSQAGGEWTSARFEVREALGMRDYSDTDSLFLAFVFESNTDGLTGRGAFLDDIRIQKRVPGPVCQVSVSSLEFGDVEVGESVDLPFTVFNLGDRRLDGEIEFSCDDFELIGGTSISIGPSSQIDRTLRFQPQTDGRQSCSVSIADALCLPIEASGTGIVFTLPAIQHSPVATASAGQALTLTTTLNGEGPPEVPSLTLWYRAWTENGLAWRTLAFSENLGTFSAEIPGVEVTLGGLEYYLELSQGDLSGTLPVDAPASVFGVTTSSVTAAAPFKLPGGGEQTGYRMISVPGETANRAVSSVLIDDLGAYADTVWRFFKFVDQDYVEYPASPAARFEPGQAYWVLHRDAGRGFDASSLSSRSLDPFEIDLQPGWTDIANPFAEDLPSSSATVIVGSADGPYAFDGQWRAPDATARLDPWRGYSYFNPGTTTARLRIDPGAPDPGLARPLSEDEWKLRLSIQSGEAIDEVVVGVGPDYSDAKDASDFVEPRKIGGSVSLFVEKTTGRPWTQDLRKLGAASVTWDLGTSAPAGSHCVLSWSTEGRLPQGWAVRVLSSDALRLLGEGSHGRVSLQSRERTFIVLLAPLNQLEDETNLRLKPRAADLIVLGPNPVRESVQLELRVPEPSVVGVGVFDARGRRVRSLGEGLKAAGAYKLLWDGSDDRGRKLPAGVYFVRFASRGESITRRLNILR